MNGQLRRFWMDNVKPQVVKTSDACVFPMQGKVTLHHHIVVPTEPEGYTYISKEYNEKCIRDSPDEITGTDSGRVYAQVHTQIG